MLVARVHFGVATPLAIIGDRLSCFHFAEAILLDHGPRRRLQSSETARRWLDHAGQILVGAIGGVVFGLVMRRKPRRCCGYHWTFLIFVALPIVAIAIFLWPVLGTHYGGLPIDAARCHAAWLRAIRFSFSSAVSCSVSFSNASGQEKTAASQFSRTSVGAHFCLGRLVFSSPAEASPWRASFIASPTFSYDGTQYKGADRPADHAERSVLLRDQERGRSARGRSALASRS